MRALLKWFAARINNSKTKRPPAESVLVVKRVWIDKNECTLMTLCHAETEGLIEYSKELGTTVVKEHALKRTQKELKQLLEANDVCAMAAFYLETEDGRVLNLDDDEVQQSIKTGTYRWA